MTGSTRFIWPGHGYRTGCCVGRVKVLQLGGTNGIFSTMCNFSYQILLFVVMCYRRWFIPMRFSTMCYFSYQILLFMVMCHSVWLIPVDELMVLLHSSEFMLMCFGTNRRFTTMCNFSCQILLFMVMCHSDMVDSC